MRLKQLFQAFETVTFSLAETEQTDVEMGNWDKNLPLVWIQKILTST